MTEDETLTAMHPGPSTNPSTHNALVRRLRNKGVRIQRETLFTYRHQTAGTRAGLFDDAGCYREEFFDTQGLRGDITKAISALYNGDGKAPTFWATEAIVTRQSTAMWQ